MAASLSQVCATAALFVYPHPSQLRSALRSEGLVAFLTFAVPFGTLSLPNSPFPALRAEGEGSWSMLRVAPRNAVLELKKIRGAPKGAPRE